MGDFAYFRERQHTYRPSTPAAALRAIHCGLAEKEELIHQGINVKPLIEEPFDIKELQRIQSREDLDLDTNLLLHRIFSRMLHDPDQERALFAAESINRLENRYNSSIEELKGELRRDREPETSLALARQYFELALMNDESVSIQNFYLREGFQYVRDYIADESIDPGFLDLAVRILVALEMYDQAARVLTRAAEPDDPTTLLLVAEVAFHQRDYATVYSICGRLKGSYNRLDALSRATIDQWTGI